MTTNQKEKQYQKSYSEEIQQDKEFLYWFIPDDKQYYKSVNKEKAIEYIKTNLAKYIKNKYKEYKPVIVAGSYTEKEIQKRNKSSIDRVVREKKDKVLHDLYNMEAEFYAQYEIREAKKNAL